MRANMERLARETENARALRAQLAELQAQQAVGPGGAAAGAAGGSEASGVAAAAARLAAAGKEQQNYRDLVERQQMIPGFFLFWRT